LTEQNSQKSHIVLRRRILRYTTMKLTLGSLRKLIKEEIKSKSTKIAQKDLVGWVNTISGNKIVKFRKISYDSKGTRIANFDVLEPNHKRSVEGFIASELTTDNFIPGNSKRHKS